MGRNNYEHVLRRPGTALRRLQEVCFHLNRQNSVGGRKIIDFPATLILYDRTLRNVFIAPGASLNPRLVTVSIQLLRTV
jgi:hypothetical protein